MFICLTGSRVTAILSKLSDLPHYCKLCRSKTKSMVKIYIHTYTRGGMRTDGTGVVLVNSWFYAKLKKKRILI